MSKAGALGVLLASLIAVGVGVRSAGAQAPEPARPAVVSLTLNGVVDPFAADYVQDGIAAAGEEGAEAVLLTIDTPGGLDSSMRQIIGAILNSPVPVICYTAPEGARAASAGTFIMLACPVNAMAPGTNIGAAHPVGVSGAIEQDKVTNDAAAFIRSLAERWDRNANWAEDAVRDSVSVSAEEALRIGVVDFIEPSAKALLNAVGPCAAGGGSVTETGLLRTSQADRPNVCDARLAPRSLGLGAAILHGLIDPNLAFLFFWGGIILIVVELLHPGLSVPGVLGTVMLISAFVSFGFLPVQLAGILLLIASAVFFLFELKHPGLGVPTVGGVVCLVLGGLLLFNPSVPSARVSPWLIVVVAAAAVGFFAFVVRAALRARHGPIRSGAEGMVGEEGVALDDLAPRGTVRAHRETWSAETAGPPIPAGTPIRVVRLAGVRLIVEPAPPTSTEGELAGPRSGQEGGVR